MKDTFVLIKCCQPYAQWILEFLQRCLYNINFVMTPQMIDNFILYINQQSFDLTCIPWSTIIGYAEET